MLLSAFALAGAAAYVTKVVQNRKRTLSDILPVVHFAVLGGILGTLPFVVRTVPYGGYADYSAESLGIAQFAFLAFTNAYFVAFVIASIFAGVAKKDSFTVNVSLAAITVFVFAKYFDWFFDMMDRALFFIF